MISCKKLLVTSFLLAASLSFSASLSAMDKLFEPIPAPKEKTYKIRHEIAEFCKRQDVQTRLSEKQIDRHYNNIDDITAYFLKTVENPARFSAVIYNAMQESYRIVRITDKILQIPSPGAILANLKTIPLLHKNNTPLLHACIQNLCQKANVSGEPLIMLVDDVNWRCSTDTNLLDDSHPVILISKNYCIDQMSDQGIEGGLAHEMGHIKCQHEQIIEKIPASLTENQLNKIKLTHENEADNKAIYEFDEAENFIIFMQEADVINRHDIEKLMLDEDFQLYTQENPEKIKAQLDGTADNHPSIQERINKALTALREKREF